MSVWFDYNNKPEYQMWFFKENQEQTSGRVKLRRYKDGKFVVTGKATQNNYFTLSRTVFKKGKYLVKIKTDLFESSSSGLLIYLNAQPSQKELYFQNSVQNDLFSYNAQTGIFEIYEDTQCLISLAVYKGYNSENLFYKTFEVNINKIDTNNVEFGVEKLHNYANLDYTDGGIRLKSVLGENSFTITGGTTTSYYEKEISDRIHFKKGKYYFDVKNSTNILNVNENQISPYIAIFSMGGTEVLGIANRSGGIIEVPFDFTAEVFFMIPGIGTTVLDDTIEWHFYKLSDLNTIYISGAGYVDYPFKNIDRESQLGWDAPVWGSSLKRTLGFTLETVDSAAFGTVARVELNLKYLNSEDYKVLADMSKERAVYVTYFNRETGKWVERQEMSFTSQEIEKLYATNTNYIGVFNTKIKLVATNRDKAEKTYTIKLNSNYTGSTEAAVVATANWCEGFELSDDIFTQSGKSIKYWSTTADTLGGKTYLANSLLTVTDDLELYAIWE